MHHVDLPSTSPAAAAEAADSRRWYQTLTRYHWFVLVVAALGWLFDCLDQQLFTLARPAVMEDVVKKVVSDPPDPTADRKETQYRRSFYGDLATSIFIAGWACGGLFFGVLGDRIGRAKTMLLTILLYSLFTGLSALSVGFWDFALYRFLTGLGVGGEFAVGVALVAEVMPSTARSQCLTLLQALSAFGNISAAFINLGLGVAQEEGLVSSPWRIMFVIGAAPALLALVIRSRLKEPETWQKASHDDAVQKQLGSYRELFGTPMLRKHAILGLILGCSGIVGLWSVGFFTPDLIRRVQLEAVTKQIGEEELADAKDDKAKADVERAISIRKEKKDVADDDPVKPVADRLNRKITGRLTRWQSYVLLMLNVGAACGMVGFGTLAYRIGRKPTFAIAFLAAFVSTVVVFSTLSEFWQIFVLVPIMGFCQLSLFAGYAIYFPELFPTRLRSTGTSFCYNVGRFFAATGPLAKGLLEGVFKDTPEPLRYAGVTMCSVFLVGLVVLPFLPETRGKPLPE